MIPDGYRMKFTWFMDFGIAEAFGPDAVKDTYRRAYGEWKGDVTAMKELTLCLNFRCWDFHHAGNEAMSRLYAKLYHECYDKCLDSFKGDELTEYWSFLD